MSIEFLEIPPRSRRRSREVRSQFAVPVIKPQIFDDAWNDAVALIGMAGFIGLIVFMVLKG